VRVRKLIENELDDGQPAELKEKLSKMADEMLANPVIEDFDVQV
jgi:phosphoribosylformylglycinamidine synthase